MKKLFNVVIAFLLFFSTLTIVACEKNNSERDYYKIDAVYDENTKTLSANMNFVFVNDTDAEISELKFNLFGNAYRENAEYRPVSAGYTSLAYYAGVNYGKLDVESVNGNVAEWKICGKDENILSVTLLESVFPNENCSIEIQYALTLANVNHRTGVTANTVNLGNFYPQLCAYDNGFYECEYYASGDPFYSECADYDITLTVDSSFAVAASGEKEAERAAGNNTVYTYSLKNARDFCFVLGKNFNVIEKKVNDVSVLYYYYGDVSAEENLEISAECIKYFGETFGEYPYKTYSVVQTGFCYGGMEYPALSMVSDALYGINYKYVIAHETAHQWWYSAVGNNQLENAWQDEGLTEYSTVMFFENHPEYKLEKKALVQSAYSAYKSYFDVYSQLKKETDTAMNRKLSEFSGDYEYVNVTYNKGTILFDNLRESLGDNKFKSGLKRYYSEYCYKIAKPENLISSFQKTGVDVVGFFSSYLSGKAVI